MGSDPIFYSRGITEAEIVREALDREERYGAREMRTAVDPEAGAQFLRFIRSLGRRRAKGPAGRTWTRESLYGERVDRWT